MSNAYSFQRARELRRVSTPAERRLWECLRDRRLQGLKFRRQQPLHGYILDFYCADRRLVVELDGAVHQDREQQAYDSYRNDCLQGRGLTVLRFTNREVERSPEAVLARIAAAAAEMDVIPATSPRPAGTPLHANSGRREGPQAAGGATDDDADVDRSHL